MKQLYTFSRSVNKNCSSCEEDDKIFVKERIRNKHEITSSSFAFTVAEEGGDRWYKTSDGELHRDILIIDRLYDVSPVYEPAYLSTSCSKRAKEMIEKNDVICAKMDAMMAEMETFLIK